MASLVENSTLPLALLMLVLVVRAYYLIFALLTIVGGVMGYVKAKSVVSLVSGSVSGILLIAASLMLHAPPAHTTRAFVIGLVVSVLLAGKFVPDFVHKKAVFPGGLMAVLGVAGIVLSVLALNGK